jgi:hypothetical protein
MESLHPRPDFQREAWLDLCGEWEFEFDPQGKGWNDGWFLTGRRAFERRIQVPYSWAAPLSGIGEEFEGAGWYARELTELPAQSARPYLVFGAVDWTCDAWLNGAWLGHHEGGYLPFEFDLTPYWRPDESNRLVVRAHDVNAKDTLRGKQGYGSVSGLWQPARLECRGDVWLRRVHLTPDVEGSRVWIDAICQAAAPLGALPLQHNLPDHLNTRTPDRLTLELLFDDPTVPTATTPISVAGGEGRVAFSHPVPDARLWCPEDPHLYGVRARLRDPDGVVLDEVRTYFGMRSIRRARLPNREFECVLLNGEPLYAAGALDQCFHPIGYYTYPTDEDMRRDIELAKAAGFNALRFHIKAEDPRKLYWADRLGLLVMCDIPNSWGEPTPAACRRWEAAMRGQLERDHNHPCIWTWIAFNETWGLTRTHYEFTPELAQSASIERPTEEWRKRVEGELAGQFRAQVRRPSAPGFTAAEELLFRHELRGHFRYHLRGLDDARVYRLAIGNVELSHPHPGYRVYELKVNGQRVREPIDYAAEFELRKPSLIEVEVHPKNGRLDISFEPIANHARISFLRLYDRESGELVFSDYAFERIESGELAPAYLPDTQAWVRRMWEEMKRLDPSRLIEDNSAVLLDHVMTDLNTWHFYLHRPSILRAHVERVVADTYPGSEWNFVGGNCQDGAPLMNSECGNYWDIEYGAGDSDLSYHFKYMLNEFRRHPKLCGFVFTELYDVVNEWNGFLRYDRSRKQFGYEAYCPGMTTADLMGPDLVVIDTPPCATVTPGAAIEAPLLASFLPGGPAEPLTLHWRVTFLDSLAGDRIVMEATQSVERRRWEVVPVVTVRFHAPEEPGLLTLATWFEDASGGICGRNYVQWSVEVGVQAIRRSGVQEGESEGEAAAQTSGAERLNAPSETREDGTTVVRFDPAAYSRAEWPLLRQVNDGEKVSGFGAGFFEYEISLADLGLGEGASANPKSKIQNPKCELLLEAGAKRTLPRDRDELILRPESDLGIFSAVSTWKSGSNPNDYPQTDETPHPSTLEISVNGRLIHNQPLPDDPADARGVLSWHHQRSTTRLEDAGSYGYLIRCALPEDLVAEALRDGVLCLRLAVSAEAVVEDAGGLALYGPRFGRYPFGPTLLFSG